MTEEKQNPQAVAAAAGGEKSKHNIITTDNSTARPRITKKNRILLELYRGASLNLFEAEVIGDHSLHSTISTLSNSHGIKFSRRREKVPNRFGSMTSVVRYRLDPASIDTARRHLERAGLIGGGK